VRKEEKSAAKSGRCIDLRIVARALSVRRRLEIATLLTCPESSRGSNTTCSCYSQFNTSTSSSIFKELPQEAKQLVSHLI